jgi:hypothetical protein
MGAINCCLPSKRRSQRTPPFALRTRSYYTQKQPHRTPAHKYVLECRTDILSFSYQSHVTNQVGVQGKRRSLLEDHQTTPTTATATLSLSTRRRPTVTLQQTAADGTLHATSCARQHVDDLEALAVADEGHTAGLVCVLGVYEYWHPRVPTRRCGVRARVHKCVWVCFCCHLFTLESQNVIEKKTRNRLASAQ